MTRISLGALGAAVPIVVGYVPVALTFGMAGIGAGLTPWQTVTVSALVFAGASQFLLVASLHGGASWWGVLATCALLNARHVLYGAVLRRWLPSRRGNALLAFGLTDEVFALALNKMAGLTEPSTRWLATLGGCAWVAWVGGTLLGVSAGALFDQYPFLSRILSFASPALFIALAVQSTRRDNAWALLASALCALILLRYGQPGAAIFGGAAVGAIVQGLLLRAR